MKILLISLLAALAANAFATPISDVPETKYSRFIEYTDEDGNSKTIDLEEDPDVELLNSVLRNPENNLYILFTRQNPTEGQILVINDEESILSSNFDAALPTVVIAHGWLDDQDANMNPLLRDAFLEKEDTNVIILDWRKLANSNYITSARGVPAVGRGLGRFLAFLSSVTGASYDNMHLVGFSLGAHLVGNAGRELGGKIARITALDPAGPLWNFNSDKIKSGDAQYVEGIHTDGGLSISLGIGYAIGDVDFFPNGGNSQPGCLTSICHHNRAWRLFAATVTYDHLVGRKCSTYVQISTNLCFGQRLNMGNSDLRKTGSGKYHVRTRRRYPF